MRIASLTDGTSNSLMITEVAAGPLLTGAARTRVSDCYSISGSIAPTGATITHRSGHRSMQCRQLANEPDPLDQYWRYKGYTWLEGSMWRNWMNTIRTPNQTCCTPGEDSSSSWHYILKPASSYHPGGVNAALCDGSVKFFKESVSPPVWMSLGTRAGGEVLSSDSY